MVFIRREVIEGSVYYQYVKSYRKGRKVEVRAISNLRKHSSLQDALDGARRVEKEERIRRSGFPKKGGGPWHSSERE